MPRLAVGDTVTVELTNVTYPAEKTRPDPKIVMAEVVSIDAARAHYRLFVEEFGHVRTGYGTTSIIKNFEDVEAWMEDPNGAEAV